MILRYLRRLIRENRSLRRQNADLAGLLYETSHALSRSVARNLELSDSLNESSRTIRELLG